MSVLGVPVPGIVPHRQDGAFDGTIAFALWKMVRDQAVALNRISAGEVPVPDPFPPGRFRHEPVSARLRAHAEAINRLGGAVAVPAALSDRDSFDAVVAEEIRQILRAHAKAINVLAAV